MKIYLTTIELATPGRDHCLASGNKETTEMAYSKSNLKSIFDAMAGYSIKKTHLHSDEREPFPSIHKINPNFKTVFCIYKKLSLSGVKINLMI